MDSYSDACRNHQCARSGHPYAVLKVFLQLPFLLLALGIAHSAVAQNPASQIAQLNASGRSAEAYQLALEVLPEYEGDPAFDLHYGVAAVDVGRASEGAFALERVLMSQPANDYARLELGRAYFALEEDERAEREFSQVLASNPPDEVTKNVRPYLRAIQARRAQRETTVVANVELGTGYDSNVLASPGTDTFFIPLLGDDATLASSQFSDVFYQLKVDATINHPVRHGTNLFATARMNLRENNQGFELLDPADPASAVGLGRIFGYGVRGGVGHEIGASNFRLAAEYDIMEIDKRGYRDSLGLRGSWRYAWTPQSSMTIYAQAHDLEYQDLAFKDSLMAMGGLTFQHQFIAPMRPVVAIGGVLGDENAENEDLPGALSTADRDIVGANASLTLTPAVDWQLMAGVDVQQSRYSGASLNALPAGAGGGDVFVTRDDTQYNGRISLSWLAADNLLLKLDGSLGKAKSNIAIFDYDRDQIIFSVRYTYQ